MFTQSAESRLADECPGGTAAEDIAGENGDERSYGGPFGACGYEEPRDFRSTEEIDEERRRLFGPSCVGLC